MVGAGEFGLGQGGVDFVVTDLVQKNGRPALAAPELGDEVVLALRHVPGDRAAAERAEGVGVHDL